MDLNMCIGYCEQDACTKRFLDFHFLHEIQEFSFLRGIVVPRLYFIPPFRNWECSRIGCTHFVRKPFYLILLLVYCLMLAKYRAVSKDQDFHV